MSKLDSPIEAKDCCLIRWSTLMSSASQNVVRQFVKIWTAQQLIWNRHY